MTQFKIGENNCKATRIYVFISIITLTIKDKEAVLRKAKLLRGSNILITEDFPRRVREHRAELARFAKEVRKLALCCVS